MDFTYPGIIMVSWAGLAAGLALSLLSQEEVAGSTKWISRIKKTVWLLLGILSANGFIKEDIAIGLFLTAFFIFISAYESRIPVQALAVFLGAGVFLSSADAGQLFLAAALAFIYFTAEGISPVPAPGRSRKDKGRNAVVAQTLMPLMRKAVSSVLYPLSALALYLAVRFVA